MQTQSQSQHARAKAHVVVNPVGWTAVMVLSGHMSAYPYSDIRGHIEASRIWIGLVLINWRSPVNRDATQNEAKKDRHIQPVTPSHQEMVLPGHEHARLFRKRACSCRCIVSKCWKAHWWKPLLHCVSSRCCRDKKDFVGRKHSVWQLFSRCIDGIA